MPAEEHEIAIDITCINLPSNWSDGRGPLQLGIQYGQELANPAPTTQKRVTFHPVLRVRKHSDGSPTFLGPFTHGPRTGRFIYLIWATLQPTGPGAMLGRVKLLLDHLRWPDIEKALARKKPLKVTLNLTNPKGHPVCASVRPPDVAEWDL